MEPEQSYSFEAELWLYPGEKAAWHFITVPLDISAQLGDLDGSEELTVTISGIPEGVTLSGGEKNSDVS